MSTPRTAFLVLTAALVFALLVSNASAQGFSSVTCIINNSATTIGGCVAAAIPLAVLGVALSFMFAALAYIAGDILNYTQFKGFYRRELWEATKSAIIVGIIFSSIAIASSVATALAGNTPQIVGQGGVSASSSLTSNLGSLYSTANSMYLQPQLSSAYTSFAGLLGLNIGSDLLKSATFSLYFPIPIPTIKPPFIIGAIQVGADFTLFQSNYISSLTSTGPFSSLLSVAATEVNTLMFVFQFQSDLLYVIAMVGLGAFLPLGLILRAIPFLRPLGGSLIAMAIGLCLVYPMLLVGFNLPVTNYMYGLTSSTQSQPSCPPTPFSSALLCSLWNGFVSFLKTVDTVTGFSSGVGLLTGGLPLQLAFGKSAAITNTAQAQMLAAQGFWTGIFGPFSNGIFPALNFVVDNTLNQFVQFILLAIDLIIGYAITSGIANLLGGTITLGVGRFKLA